MEPEGSGRPRYQCWRRLLSSPLSQPPFPWDAWRDNAWRLGLSSFCVADAYGEIHLFCILRCRRAAVEIERRAASRSVPTSPPRTSGRGRGESCACEEVARLQGCQAAAPPACQAARPPRLSYWIPTQALSPSRLMGRSGS